ncbi:MAG: SAM hydroxide adenosyltransferase, partial [Actinomycetes bacterium]
PLHLAVRSGDQVAAEVLWVDHFGNAQLNVTASEIAPFGPHIDVDLGGPRPTPATVADAYGALPPGAVGLVPDSVGLLALCMDRRSAALTLGLRAGTPVTLTPG